MGLLGGLDGQACGSGGREVLGVHSAHRARGTDPAVHSGFLTDVGFGSERGGVSGTNCRRAAARVGVTGRRAPRPHLEAGRLVSAMDSRNSRSSGAANPMRPGTWQEKAQGVVDSFSGLPGRP